MANSISYHVNLRVDEIYNNLKGDAFGNFCSTTVHKHYTPYMPNRTGDFFQKVDFKPFQYVHTMYYAEDVYTINKNYRKDKHPFATSHYVENGSATAMPKIENDISTYIKDVIL